MQMTVGEINMSIKQTIKDAVAAGGPVVVDFWNDGCAPCKGLAMQLETVQKKHPNVTVIKVKAGESEEADEIFKSLNIRNTPTMYLYNNSTELKVHVGILPASKILDILDVE